MRVLIVLTLALVSAVASAGGVHKCEKANGVVYYTDKACSTKNSKRQRTLRDDASSDAQPDAPPPPKKPVKR